MGSPLALSQSVTRGMVSNTKLIMPRFIERFAKFTLDGEDVGAMVRWIGHDAAIYPGNSGGPLVNLQGKVVGINEINLGLGGAIPANLAREVADQIVGQGRVRRSWLGVEVQPLLKSSEASSGALVSSIIEGSPADCAGIRAGDSLLALDGKPVHVRYREELPLLNQLVAAIPVDKEIEVELQRDGETKKVKLRTEEREPAEPRQVELKPWGLTARNISLLTAKEMKLTSRDGVLVTSVRPGGPAGSAKPSLIPQDILREIEGRTMRNVEELMVLTDRLTGGKVKSAPVTVRFERERASYLTVIRIGTREMEDLGREVRKAWLPVAVQAITRELAEHLGDPSLTGVRVTQVFPETAAEKAGLQVGDLILAVDDDKISASHPGDEEVFASMIRQRTIGSAVSLTVRRGAETKKVRAELVQSPPLEREMKRYNDTNFEFAARDLSFFDKMREGWKADQTGVLVTEVKEGGWAALGQLAINDLILTVNGDPVRDVQTIERRFQELAAQKARRVVLYVRRGIHGRFLEVQPKWDQHP